MKLICSMLLILFSLAVTMSCLLSLLPFITLQDNQLHWILWIAGQFRFQYLILQGLALLSIGYFCFKVKAKTFNMAVYTVLVLTSFAINAYFIAPYYSSSHHKVDVSARIKPIKLILSNVGFITNYKPLLSLIETTQPDIVCIVELEPKLAQIFHSGRFEHLYPFQREDNSSQLGLYSKLPIVKSTLSPPNLDSGTSLESILKYESSKFTLVLSHPVVPYSSQALRRQEHHFQNWQKIWKNFSQPLIIAGDMNATPWSPEFGALLKLTSLKDSALGFGIQPSWSVDNPILAVPIDHVLVSRQFHVANRAIGPEVGSDHRPVLVTLELSH